MPETISRVILPALEAPRMGTLAERFKNKPGNREEDEESETPDDPMTRALLPAIEDMRTLVGHVSALLNGPVAAEKGTTNWLRSLQAALDTTYRAVANGKMSSRPEITMQDEEPAGLDEALSRA